MSLKTANRHTAYYEALTGPGDRPLPCHPTPEGEKLIKDMIDYIRALEERIETLEGFHP